MFQTILAGFGAVLGLSVPGAASLKYYDKNLIGSEHKYYIGNCILILLFVTMLVLSCSFFLKNYFSVWFGVDPKLILLSIVASSATVVVLVRMGQWQVRNQSGKYSIFQVSQSFLNLIFSLVLVVYFQQGAIGRILVMAYVPIVLAVIALMLLYKDDLLGFAWRPKYLWEILAFGIPLVPHSVGMYLLSFADRFVVNDQMGLEQVGVYMVASQLISVLSLALDAINNAYIPWLFERLSRNDMAEKRQIVRWTYLYCVCLLIIAGAAFILAPHILILIAGERYSAAGDIVGWLALAQAFHGMYLMVTNYIFYSQKTGVLSLATVASGLFNIILLVILTRHMGLKGAAIAQAASMALKFLMTWFAANLRHPMPWFNFNRSNNLA
jgi:O-antigen/teichoic acid export membrane protein